jgi:hypothetical protein
VSPTTEFYKSDFSSSLFPLKTNLFLIEHHGTEISDYIYQKVLNAAHTADNFLPQQKVYATKPKGHLSKKVSEEFSLDSCLAVIPQDFSLRSK